MPFFLSRDQCFEYFLSFLSLRLCSRYFKVLVASQHPDYLIPILIFVFAFFSGKNDIEHMPDIADRKDGWTEVELKRSFRKLHNAIQDKTFNFLLNNYTLCKRDVYNASEVWDLIIVVVSKVDNFLQRNTIRNTWASELSHLKAAVVFLVGRSLDSRLNKQVVKEAELYHDVVQVELLDDYKMLTFKSISMLQWLNDYCTNSRFYLKADDDVYVNVENVLREFKRSEDGRFFLCHVFKKAPPIREHFSKWFVSAEEFSGKFYPTYCSGTAYGFTSSILTPLYRSALQAKVFRMEDVFITGIAAEHIGVKHIHSWGFSFLKREPTGCAYQNVSSGHEVTVRQMYVIYAQLMNKEVDCDTKENRYLLKAEREN